MTGRPFAAVDNSYDDYKLPILSKPVAHNIQIITDYEAVKESTASRGVALEGRRDG